MKAFEVLGLGLIIVVLAFLSLGAVSNPAAFAKLIQPTAPQLSGDPDSVQRAPTVSAQFIDQLLCTYPTIENHSPACGTGQNIYNLGVQYGIDPAVPLGFFWEESNFGTKGEAAKSHSLGNLRSSPLEAFEADGYAQFYDWQTGEKAWFVLIHDLYIKQWGLTTVPAILQRYAPSGDGNNPSHYAQVVESSVSLWRSGKVALP
jgi:hypothetical protein